MKRLLAIAIAALALPTVALAIAPPPLATRNAAMACKAERAALGAKAFAAKYGANHNTRNAFGKCVSLRARSMQQAEATGLFEPSSGSISSATSGSTRNLSVTGTVANGHPIMSGSLSEMLAVNLSLERALAGGGYCAPASGTAKLSDNATPTPNTISKSEAGTFCQLGSPASSEEIFFGTYTVTAGTGKYAGASGSGHAVFDSANGSTLNGVEWGSFSA